MQKTVGFKRLNHLMSKFEVLLVTLQLLSHSVTYLTHTLCISMTIAIEFWPPLLLLSELTLALFLDHSLIHFLLFP